MKMKLLRIMLLSIIVCSGALLAGELHWEKDLQTAFDKASSDNRPLMVMVESKTCRWCIKMKQRTLRDDTIAARLKAYVLVKIDRDEIKSEFVPYAKYVPTIYFMTPKKKILETVTGYFGVLDFNSWIDDTEKKLKSSK